MVNLEKNNFYFCNFNIENDEEEQKNSYFNAAYLKELFSILDFFMG